MTQINTKLRIDDAGCIDDQQHEWRLRIDGVRGRYGFYSYSGMGSVAVHLACERCGTIWISVERQSKLREFLSRWRTEYLCRRDRRDTSVECYDKTVTEAEETPEWGTMEYLELRYPAVRDAPAEG